MNHKDLYINKKTFKCLELSLQESYSLKDNIWIIIPNGAEECYWFDVSDQDIPEGIDGLFFFKSDLKYIWGSDQASPNWCYFDVDSKITGYVRDYGKLVWKRDVINNHVDDVVENCQTKKLIKSDGGSSDYYKREIPEGMLERWNNAGFIEAKDVMKLFLGNDYNFCNSFKAHCRVQSLREGVGKDGASEKYDLRKAWFFCEDAYNNYLEVNESVKRK